MIGFGFGGILMGRISDRIGVMLPVLFGGVSMGTGFYIASLSTTFLQLSLVHGVLIGFFGMSTTFAPLVADISHWFNRRRGWARLDLLRRNDDLRISVVSKVWRERR